MNRTQIRVEIEAPREKVWQLITEPKEMEMWSPTLRDLTYDPPGAIQVGTMRKARVESGGKIREFNTQVTHCEPLDYFTEEAQGENPFVMGKVKSVQLTYRLESEEKDRTTFIFTVQYDIPGFLGRLINKAIGESMLRAAVKQNFERLKTYAETGRTV
jgi:uncharacterized protein YndB with AHSA1/START domain